MPASRSPVTNLVTAAEDRFDDKRPLRLRSLMFAAAGFTPTR
jgi:hypothetical protein